MKNLFKTSSLILSLTLFLYSCNKESIIEPLNTKERLQAWYEINTHPEMRESVIWENWKAHPLPDSSIAFEIPVSTKSGLKELFIFQTNGKQDAIYKEFNVTPAGLEIKISSLSGRVVKNGIIAKIKGRSMKGKNIPMREMNDEAAPLVERGDLAEYICVGVRLRPSDWGFLGFGGWGDYTSVVFTVMDSMNFSGGGGSSGEPTDVNFKDYNYSEISSELTNECLIAVLNDMQSKNIYGEVAGILSLFKETKILPIFNFRIKEMTFKEKFEEDTKDYYGQQKNGIIALNTHLLENASKEFIAKVIMHEMLHKFILEDPVIKEYDHTVMLDKFVNLCHFLSINFMD